MVMTQVPSSIEAPRLPEMVGMATLAIDESRTTIKVAKATEIVATTCVIPFNGWVEADLLSFMLVAR